MDEGLGFALVPIFVIALPIVISSFILYFILRNKKMSIIGSIIGFIGTIIIGSGLQVSGILYRYLEHQCFQED